MSPSPEPPYQLQSLCSRCEHVRVIRSERGSTFLRCGAARKGYIRCKQSLPQLLDVSHV